METETRRCTQTKCLFFLKGGCPTCRKCGAESFVLDITCKKCLDCESIPGESRDSDFTQRQPLAQTQSIKPVVTSVQHEQTKHGMKIIIKGELR